MNVTAEKELLRNFSVSASYVGALGRKLPGSIDRNYPVFGPGATTANVNARRPFLTMRERRRAMVGLTPPAGRARSTGAADGIPPAAEDILRRGGREARQPESNRRQPQS